MQIVATYIRITILALVFGFLLLLPVACGLKDHEAGGILARVGENYLYVEDVSPLLHDDINAQDSATIVSNFINNWAAKQLLLDKAKINLSEEKLVGFDALVNDYRADLYTRAYKDALVWKGTDTVISKEQLSIFYDNEKENFKLKERVVKLRYVELPKEFSDKKKVSSSLKNFTDNDRRYLDSIAVHFKKMNFNDSLWIGASKVINEIPPLNHENEDKYLKKSQFVELEDAKGVYLAMIIEVRNSNDIAPLSFVEPTLRQVLLNRRKLEYARKLETEIIDEAIKDKEFEVYAKSE
ncbi:peptidyl-prolyl cis-trans isomerase [Aurantibacter crassamenti]|uniref:peptidyl-prolyl cis-trans isomerase n=1 Tax=Aurantibacter crassamenti TaxID=1837375 RepID=UPI00193ADC04|nr:peptidyl-prolyl cis-trans isomerase [Aurantibacter crassamenti]MBM1106495.1 peptidyl-prolyl cis-trans isomerase [Aurantibacter crassamenti]